MFERWKENSSEEQEEKERLLLLSEKELLVEILYELKTLNNKMDRVRKTIRLNS